MKYFTYITEMISLEPKSGIVKLKGHFGFEDETMGHFVDTETTLNFINNVRHFVKSETFQGTLATANGVEEDEPQLLEEEITDIVIPDDDTQDQMLDTLHLLEDNFDTTQKESLQFSTWKQYKWFEHNVTSLMEMAKGCYGSYDGWDVFVVPKHNVVYEIYYVWSGKRRVRKVRHSQLMPD